MVGQRVNAEIIGQGAVGDEALAAVDDELIPVPLGEGEHAAHVGAGGGLGQAEGAQVTALKNRGHEALELLVGGLGEVQAAAVQRGGHGEGDAQGGVYLGDLFHCQGIFHVAQALAAVFLGIGQADEAHLAEVFVQVHVILPSFVPLQNLGSDLFLGEFAGHLLDRKLLFVQFKIHGGIVSFLIGKDQLT